MADSKRNRPNGDRINGGRISTENGDNRKRYEGFEGMNYEQVRQPYSPQHKDKNGNPNNQGNENGEKM